jgi:fungal STAND N-terminal Goodbye domain
MSSVNDPAVLSPNLQPILNTALENYSKQTGKDLQSDPLSTEIQRCKSPDDILNILKKHAEKLDRNDDSKLMKYLNNIVNGLYSLSTNPVLSAGASLVSQSRFICFTVY